MTDQKCEECGEFRELVVNICVPCVKHLLHFYLYEKYSEDFEKWEVMKKQ